MVGKRRERRGKPQREKLSAAAADGIGQAKRRQGLVKAEVQKPVIDLRKIS